MSIPKILKSVLPADIVDNLIIPLNLPDKTDLLIKKRHIAKDIRDAVWRCKHIYTRIAPPDYFAVHRLRNLLRILQWKLEYKKANYKLNPTYFIYETKIRPHHSKEFLHYSDLLYFTPSTGEYLFTERNYFTYDWVKKIKLKCERIKECPTKKELDEIFNNDTNKQTNINVLIKPSLYREILSGYPESYPFVTYNTKK